MGTFCLGDSTPQVMGAVEMLTNLASRGMILLVVTAVASWVARRGSAALRHRIWGVGLLSLLALPLGNLLPTWQVAVPETLVRNAPMRAMFSELSSVPPQPEVAHPERTEPKTTATPLPTVSPSPQPRSWRLNWNWPVIALAVWGLGVAFGAVSLLYGLLQIRRVLRGSVVVTHGTVWDCFERLKAQLCLEGKVTLRQSSAVKMPLALGVLRPIVLVPDSVANWPTTKQQAVLLHELAHVRRRDVLYQLLGRMACVLHWFNPLAWYGLKRLRVERELACDDCVLQSGASAADYAEQLLTIAKEQFTASSAFAVAMAQRGSLEHRVRLLFSHAICRLPLSRRATAALTLTSAVLALGVGTAGVVTRAEEPRKTETTPSLAESTDPSAQSERAAAEKLAPGRRLIKFIVKDQNQKPFPGAHIHLNAFPSADDRSSCSGETDENGAIFLDYAIEAKEARIWCSHPEHVPMFAQFKAEEGRGDSWMPREFTFTLLPGTKLSGRIVDPQGRPIPNVAVKTNLTTTYKLPQNDRLTIVSSWLEGKYTTNADGVWTVLEAPPDENAKLSLFIQHPVYISDTCWDELANRADLTFAQYRAGTATLRMEPGIRLRGKVLSDTGEPIKDALVIWGKDPYFDQGSNEELSGEDGSYLLPAFRPHEAIITVVAKGWAPQQEQILLKPDMEPHDFTLRRGKVARIKVVDAEGKPIHASVSIRDWRGNKALYNIVHSIVKPTHIPRACNDEGVFNWDWAPDGLVFYEIEAPERRERNLRFAADGTEHVVILPLDSVVAHVTDATTGAPLETFRMIPVSVNRDFADTNREKTIWGKEGSATFSRSNCYENEDIQFYFESDGYRSFLTSDYKAGESISELQIQMEPAPPIVGRVLAHGQPVENAAVYRGDRLDSIQIDYSSVFQNGLDTKTTRTDREGRFACPCTNQDSIFVIWAAEGYAKLQRKAGEPVGDVELQPWARVKGIVRLKGNPPTKSALIFSAISPPSQFGIVRETYSDSKVTTDTFEILRMPPIPFFGGLRPISEWIDENKSFKRVPLVLRPGEETVVTIDDEGATVKGSIGLENEPTKVKWDFAHCHLVARDPSLPTELAVTPQEMLNLGETPSLSWLHIHSQTPFATHVSLTFDLETESNYTIESVPEGDYVLLIQAYQKVDSDLRLFAEAELPITVTAADVERGTLTIPPVPLKLTAAPRADNK